MQRKTLIICDLQPDVVQKLPQPRQFIDLVSAAVEAARQSNSTRIVYTMLQCEPGYAHVPLSHPRLGILRKLYANNPNLKWFTSSVLSIPSAVESNSDSNTTECVLRRSTFLPQANDKNLLEALRSTCGETTPGEHQFTLMGYGPTVQAMCHVLGDVLAMPNVQVVEDTVRDESPERCQSFLQHGLLFREEVVSMVDYLESLDVLHKRIPIAKEIQAQPPPVKYVCDCGRGGHLSLFMPYLLRDYGYVEWPTQPWYQEQKSVTETKQYQCPMGRRVVDLCDEPQFSLSTNFFLAGRRHLDEKDLLCQLVPELMPPTFASIEDAQNYAAATIVDSEKLVWFLKKVNQNGGRAVKVMNALPGGRIAADEQLQVHVPRPLLHEGKYKCHVKTYQYISCTTVGTDSDPPVWHLYMHDLFYLATASRCWSPEDLSDDAQITTMRTHRLYPDNPWRVEWKLTEKCRANILTVLQRAIEQGKLQMPPSTQSSSCHPANTTLQFEINSADWMLDEDGRMYLIECNGIPVLYDAGMSQPLLTKGLKLYDRLYKQDPESAVVNDHDLLKDAIRLAIKGTLPKTSLWKHISTIPSR